MIQTVALEHDLRSARTARHFAADLLTGQDRDLVDSVALMVTELVTNAVKHSQAPCTLTVELDRTSVHVEVSDSGSTAPTMRSPGPTETSGRGLQIVANLADDWGTRFTPTGKAVWFRIGFDSAEAA